MTPLKHLRRYTQGPLNPMGLFLLNSGPLLLIFLTLKSFTWLEISIKSLKDKIYNQAFFSH